MSYAVSQKKDRKHKVSIPDYTLAEELVSSISHGIGAGLGIAALCLCVIRATVHGDAYAIVSSWIYGFSLVILYSMSCIYHGLAKNNAKRVMRVMDHCTIFLLIAGTYTPFTLVSLRHGIGWPLFGIIWGTAVLGIVLNAVDVERFEKISMVCYLAMGWAILFTIRPLFHVISAEGIKLLIAGGIAYTAGAVIYGLGNKRRYMHSVWHFFVLAGSILHFFTIYQYVI